MYEFDKSRRLLTKKHYNHVFSKAKRVVTPGLLLLARPNDQEQARLGLAISKKHLAKAVQRNRLKRLIRESFRLTRLQNVDVIALARNDVSSMSNREIRTKLELAWQKLNRICKD